MLSFNRALNDVDDTIDPSLALQDHDPSALSSGYFLIPETPVFQGAGSGRVGGGHQSTSIQDVMRNAGISLSYDSVEELSQAQAQNQPRFQSGTGQRTNIKDFYPHVSRRTDSDFDSFAMIDWSKCSSNQIYDICTSPHMQCGASKSMAYVLNYAVKQLNGDLSCFCPGASAELKRLTQKSIKPNANLKAAIEKCCESTGVLHSLQQSMTQYTSHKANTVRFKPGAFPEVSVASLLVFLKEPTTDSR